VHHLCTLTSNKRTFQNSKVLMRQWERHFSLTSCTWLSRTNLTISPTSSKYLEVAGLPLTVSNFHSYLCSYCEGHSCQLFHIILQLNALRSHPKEACIGCKSQALWQYTHDPCGSLSLSDSSKALCHRSKMGGDLLSYAMVCLMYARASHPLTAHCHIQVLWIPWRIVG